MAALGPLAVNVTLAALFAALAVAHVAAARRTGDWATAMPIVVQEGLLVTLFLGRRRSRATSTRPLAWTTAIGGTVLPLLLRPTDPEGVLASIGQPVQALSVALLVACTAVLGRSIGVVAADRGVQTAGVYRVVRHPMYASALASYVGYVFSYPSLWNAAVAMTTLLAFVVRATVEERFLLREPAYRDYLARVRWRFVPFVY